MNRVRMPYRSKRFIAAGFLTCLLAALACQLPSRLIESVQSTETPRPVTPTITPVLVSTPTSLYPPPVSPPPSTGYPGVLTETAFPTPPTLTASSPSVQDTPSTTVQPTIQESGETTTSTSSAENLSAEATSTAAAQAAALTPAGYPYPGAGSFPTYDPYPQFPGVTLTPMDNPYPSPGSSSPTLPSSYPGLTTPFLFVTGTPSPTSGVLITGSPSATDLQQPGATSGSTATPTPTTVFFTPTVTPTRTRFVTPTPTLTPTPTFTRTPLPYPPWVNVKLQASNPLTVQLASGKPQLVEFFAFWNGPSLAMAPLIQGLEREYSGQANFVYLDIDDPATDHFKQQLHFRTEPHFFLLDERGKVLNQWVGYVSVSTLRQALDAALH